MRSRVLGWSCVGFGAFVFAGFLNSTVHRPWPVQMANVLLFAGGPLYAGCRLLQRDTRKTRELESLAEMHREAGVVRLARRRQGRLTVASLVAETGMGALQAEQTLEQLARRGVADPQVNSSGALVYEFTGLLEEANVSPNDRTLED